VPNETKSFGVNFVKSNQNLGGGGATRHLPSKEGEEGLNGNPAMAFRYRPFLVLSYTWRLPYQAI